MVDRAKGVTGDDGERAERSESAALAELASDGAFRTVLESLTEGLVLSDLEGRLLYWNPAGLAMHGFASLDECLLKLPEFQNIFELEALDGRVLTFEEWPLPRLFRGEPLRGLTLKLHHKQAGWRRVFAYTGAVVPSLGGRGLAVLGITDLTASHSMLEALEQSEERLRLAHEVSGLGTYESDLASGRVTISPEMATLIGVPHARELSADELTRLIHPDDLREISLLALESQAPGATGTLHAELRFVRPDGEERWVSLSRRVVFDGTGADRVATRAIGTCFDTTDLRRAERRLRTRSEVTKVLAEAETLSQATPLVMEAICDSENWDFGGIWQVDEKAGVLRCAEVWRRSHLPLAEVEALTRKLCFRLGAGLPGRAWMSREPRLVPNIELQADFVRREVCTAAGLKSALAFPILAGGKVTGVIDLLSRSPHARDDKVLEMFAAIGAKLGQFFEKKRGEAEREELAAQLRRAQKMESLGQLSAGIAHDFNNALAAILGNAELALLAGPDGEIAESLEAIQAASRRAKGLVQQILTFARKQPSERRRLALGSVVEESARLLRATLPAGVALTLTVDGEVPDVFADPTQLHQVILNLGTNAWQAMRDRGGRLDIQLFTATLDEHRARTLALEPGRFACLSVSDTGEGMDARTRERIFEPFFTTKEAGEGTGLGLSVVHGIVANHQGAIDLKSAPDQGTTFHVYLPAALPGAGEAASEGIQPARGAGEEVLYVDDEVPIVSVAARMLRRLGYGATAASRASEALELVVRDPTRFALVIADLNMPELSGLELALRIRAVSPGQRMLLVSGHVSSEAQQRARSAGVNHVLRKPFTVEEFADAVSRALAEPAPGIEAALGA